MWLMAVLTGLGPAGRSSVPLMGSSPIACDGQDVHNAAGQAARLGDDLLSILPLGPRVEESAAGQACLRLCAADPRCSAAQLSGQPLGRVCSLFSRRIAFADMRWEDGASIWNNIACRDPDGRLVQLSSGPDAAAAPRMGFGGPALPALQAWTAERGGQPAGYRPPSGQTPEQEALALLGDISPPPSDVESISRLPALASQVGRVEEEALELIGDITSGGQEVLDSATELMSRGSQSGLVDGLLDAAAPRLQATEEEALRLLGNVLPTAQEAVDLARAEADFVTGRIQSALAPRSPGATEQEALALIGDIEQGPGAGNTLIMRRTGPSMASPTVEAEALELIGTIEAGSAPDGLMDLGKPESKPPSSGRVEEEALDLIGTIEAGPIPEGLMEMGSASSNPQTGQMEQEALDLLGPISPETPSVIMAPNDTPPSSGATEEEALRLIGEITPGTIVVSDSVTIARSGKPASDPKVEAEALELIGEISAGPPMEAQPEGEAEDAMTNAALELLGEGFAEGVDSEEADTMAMAPADEKPAAEAPPTDDYYDYGDDGAAPGTYEYGEDEPAPSSDEELAPGETPPAAYETSKEKGPKAATSDDSQTGTMNGEEVDIEAYDLVANDAYDYGGVEALPQPMPIRAPQSKPLEGHIHSHDGHGHKHNEPITLDGSEDMDEIETLALRLLGDIEGSSTSSSGAQGVESSTAEPTGTGVGGRARFVPKFRVDDSAAKEAYQGKFISMEEFRHRHFDHHGHGDGEGRGGQEECVFTHLTGVPAEVERGDVAALSRRSFDDPQTLAVLASVPLQSQSFLELVVRMEKACLEDCSAMAACSSVLRLDNVCLFFERSFESFRPVASPQRLAYLGHVGCGRGAEDRHPPVEMARQNLCRFGAMRGHPAGAHGAESLELVDMWDLEARERADECAHLCFSFQDSQGRALCQAAHLERSVCELFSVDYPDTAEGQGDGLYIFNVLRCDPPSSDRPRRQR